MDPNRFTWRGREHSSLGLAVNPYTGRVICAEGPLGCKLARRHRIERIDGVPIFVLYDVPGDVQALMARRAEKE